MYNVDSLEIEPTSPRREDAQHPFEDVNLVVTPVLQPSNRSRASLESCESIREFAHFSPQHLLEESLLQQEAEVLDDWNVDNFQDANEKEQTFIPSRGFGVHIAGGRYTPVPLMSDDEEQAKTDRSTPRRGGLCWAVMSCRAKAKIILEDPAKSPFGFYVEYFVIFLIVSSVACAIVETVPEMNADGFFLAMETLFTGIFSFEVLMRYWTSDSTQVYFKNYFNIIDIMSTLPGYADLIMRPLTSRGGEGDAESEEKKVKDLSHSIQTLRLAQLVKTIRLFRILRLAKVIRQSESISVVIKSIWGSLRGLWVLVSFVLLSTVLAATICFFFEAQEPDTLFESIPASIWWAAATILAVGYGDIVPQSIPGKITAIGTMLVGTVLIAVCIAVITSSFTELYQKNLYIARMKALRTRVQQSRRLSRLPEFGPKRSRGSVRLSSKELRPTKNSKSEAPDAADAATTDSDDSDTSQAQMDIADCVTQLEEMTSTLLLGFESVIRGQAQEQGAARCAELTLEILRKNSRLWFEHVRKFTEEISEAETMRPLAAEIYDSQGSNHNSARGSKAACRSSTSW